ncbi:MAG: energy transducer TonB [Bacteroidetes bacterium]|nr:energy transducer TonB [Bacteroidota bacterium]
MKVPVKIINRDSKLRKNYLLTLEGGFILSILIFLGAFNINLRIDKTDDVILVQKQEEVFIEEIIQTKQELKAPAPPRPTVPIEVPNDEILEDEIIDIDAELDFDEPMDIPIPPKPLQQKEDDEAEIFVVVENPPVLIGGISAVQSQIVYPPLALKAGIEGRVIVQFVIDKNGQVLNPTVVRGIGGGCDEEAVRAVLKAKFQPGLQRGRPVAVRYTLPITFRINSKTHS